jgi:Sigma-70 region 2
LGDGGHDPAVAAQQEEAFMRGGLRALALATVLAVLLPTAALASVAVVRLSVTPSTTTPGQSVTLAGSGCPPGARVFIDLQGPLWATTADADGSYRTTFQVPGGTNPGPMRIHATCGNRRSPTTTLTVRYSSMLPFTGPHPRMPLVVLGFGLVAAGVAALWLSRGVALQGTRPGAAGKASPAALHSAAVIEVALGPAAAKYRCRRRRGGEMRDASEQDLVARLGTDPAAFEEFYRRHVDAVTRLAVRRVGQPDQAADLVAEVFLAVIESADRYDPDRGEPIAWVMGSRSTGPRLLAADDYAELEAQIRHRGPAAGRRRVPNRSGSARAAWPPPTSCAKWPR